MGRWYYCYTLYCIWMQQSRQYKGRMPKKTLAFVAFELLQKWLVKFKRTNTPVNKNSYLCGRHFEEECLQKPLREQRILDMFCLMGRNPESSKCEALESGVQSVESGIHSMSTDRPHRRRKRDKGYCLKSARITSIASLSNVHNCDDLKSSHSCFIADLKYMSFMYSFLTVPVVFLYKQKQKNQTNKQNCNKETFFLIVLKMMSTTIGPIE